MTVGSPSPPESLRIFPISVVVGFRANRDRNLMAEHPSVFAVVRDEGDTSLEPYLTTVSYDEVSSYTETDTSMFSVPMPAEIYRWVE